MKTIDYITPLDLYAYAKENNLLNARIRICDGMAVSYYPDPRAVSKARYEIVLDVSANEPISYDELDEWSQNWHKIDGSAPAEIDALDAQAAAHYTADRGEQNRRYRRDVEAARRQEWIRARQSKLNSGGNPDDLPWTIYGYGPYRRRK